MALRVQNDAGLVEDANAYVAVADFKAYHDERGGDYAGHTDAAIEKAIVRATDYVDGRFTFVGRSRYDDQGTEWPRAEAWNSARRLESGVPAAVVRATCEYALRALAADLSPDPARSDTGAAIQRKAETVGPVEEETEYAPGAAFELPRYPVADAQLTRAGLIRSGRTLVRG